MYQVLGPQIIADLVKAADTDDMHHAINVPWRMFDQDFGAMK